MIRLFLILIITLSVLETKLANAEEATKTNVEIFYLPTKDGSLFGLVDANGNVIVTPKYKEIGGFVEGPNGEKLSPVLGANGNYGYINHKGEEVVALTLDQARQLGDKGLARFEQDGQWGYVDASGKIVIEPQFNKASPMVNGFAGIAGDDDKISYIDTTGDIVIKGPFVNAGSFSEAGLAAVVLKKEGKWGVIDTTGKLVIRPKFARIGNFSKDGLAPAAVGKDYDYLWGVINTKGKWIIKPKYEALSDFNQGFAVFKDDDLDAGVITSDGEEIYQSSDYELLLDPACDVLSHGYESVEFASLDGQPIETLNKPSYDFILGFDDQCRSLAVNDFQWGWLSRNGGFTPFEDSSIEPYMEHNYGASFAYPYGDFIPAVTQNHRLVYLDRTGNVALTTEVKSNEKSETLIVNDAQGKELWRANYPINTLIESHALFFKPGKREVVYNESALTDVRPLVQKLKDTKPRYFFGQTAYFGTGNPNPYEVDISDQSDADFGTSEVIAYHYLNEADWGRFYFMDSAVNTSEYFNAVDSQLTKTYGKPFDMSSDRWQEFDDLNLGPWDGGEVHFWEINDSYLFLLSSIGYGDGDITEAVTLSLIPKEKPKPNLLDISSADIDLVETSEESDDEVSEAVKLLAQDTSDPIVVQSRANTVLEIVKSGKSISEYDYLWTLYALLSAAYPELENGMEQSDYIVVADTAINYLDNNGVGEWVFTEQGQFKMEVYRVAGNGTAWTLRESDPQRALPYIEAALKYARDEDLWINDTYVRVLLNLDQQAKAFALIKSTLNGDPDFGDFQEFYEDSAYQDWLKSN